MSHQKIYLLHHKLPELTEKPGLQYGVGNYMSLSQDSIILACKIKESQHKTKNLLDKAFQILKNAGAEEILKDLEEAEGE